MASFTHPFLKKLDSFYKDNPALIYQNHSHSYKTLLEQTLKQLNLLQPLPQGSIIGIIGDYDLESISMLLACIEKRFIIVPLVQDDIFDSKLSEGQVDFIYQNDTLKPTASTNPKHKILQALQQNHQSGLILFSSGTTGKPKAIVHNLDKLLEVYLDKKPKTINILLFLLFDHIGGLNTLFNTLGIGACGVGIKDRKNISAISCAIQDYKISLLPASPSLLNLFILNKPYEKYDLSSLKIITYGTEQMPDSLLLRLKQTFPKIRFHQTFGTTEIGITQTKTSANAFKLENIEYKIINRQLYLKSDTQTLGYLNADNSVFDDEGYFATGDIVETVLKDNEEYIKIIGRIKEIINIGGEKVLPSEIENVISQIEGIQDCLAYGEANAITGQSISIEVVVDKNIFNPKDALGLKKIIREFCKSHLQNYKIPTKVIITESLAINERFKKIRQKAPNLGGGG